MAPSLIGRSYHWKGSQACSPRVAFPNPVTNFFCRKKVEEEMGPKGSLSTPHNIQAPWMDDYTVITDIGETRETQT